MSAPSSQPSDEREWRYDSAQDLDLSLTNRLRAFPRQPDMLVYGLRSLAALTVRAYLGLYHRLRITGREHLPKERSYILVANHTSHLDALCILAALPLGSLHRAFPAAAQDYFFVSLPRHAAAAILVNAMPFARAGNARQSLELCHRLLANAGNILIIFPEGTRSAEGLLGEFRAGVGCLVAGTDTPVLPCAIHGAFRAWPKGAAMPRPTALRLTIGPPRTYGHLPDNRNSVHAIAKDLQGAVQELLTP